VLHTYLNEYFPPLKEGDKVPRHMVTQVLQMDFDTSHICSHANLRMSMLWVTIE